MRVAELKGDIELAALADADVPSDAVRCGHRTMVFHK
jgi:hypothetical protein